MSDEGGRSADGLIFGCSLGCVARDSIVSFRIGSVNDFECVGRLLSATDCVVAMGIEGLVAFKHSLWPWGLPVALFVLRRQRVAGRSCRLVVDPLLCVMLDGCGSACVSRRLLAVS